MASAETIERRRLGRKVKFSPTAQWRDLEQIAAAVPVVRANLGDLLRGKSRAQREEIVGRILQNLEQFPDLEQWAIDAEVTSLLRQRDKLEGEPVADLSPAGGLRGGRCCSDAWFDANWETTNEHMPLIGGHYPPGGDVTLMSDCRKCGALVPPHSIRRHLCDDCAPIRQHQIWGSSPSGKMIQSLKRRHQLSDQPAHLKQARLPKAGASALRREIRRYEQTGRLPK